MIRNAFILFCAALLAIPAAAQEAANDVALETARLEDLRSIREIKNLQATWGHLAFHGAFPAMASLLTNDIELVRAGSVITGPAGVEGWLRETQGDGSSGDAFVPGILNARIFLSPVITLAKDGQSATARWHEVAMTGRSGERADWQGLTHVIDYRLDRGEWRISRIRPYEHFAGTQADGWFHDAETLERAPYHYTPDEAGRIFTGRSAAEPMSHAQLAAQSGALLDQSHALNLVNAYGYYLDRGLYDDIVDLLADDATIDVAGQGRWVGADGARRYLLRFGAPGLEQGELNDRPLLMPKTTFLPDGQIEIMTIELGMTGQHGGSGQWSISTQVFRLGEGEDGVWRIAAITRTPFMRADYETGWSDPLPAALPVPAGGEPDAETTVHAMAYPQSAYGVPLASPSLNLPLFRLEEKATGEVTSEVNALNHAEAFDGAANVSNAYGYYIDQFAWRDTAAVFSRDGWKELSYIGTFIGKDRVLASLIQRYGEGGPNDAFQAIHQKTQPYVTVFGDGTRAFVRNRLLQFNSGTEPGGSWIGGVYENQVIKEDGIWRIHGMDLDYVWLGDYDGGWMGIDPANNSRFGVSADVIAEFAPNAPLRGETFAPFPDIRPMGFHFDNPVSGRKAETPLTWSDGNRE
ncbi:nuclear transport factor 2 family protein [Aurantiacibacter rhizosphaerae]|nr:nuclear transport factor 2 family protein [Aurantiacibacter rhizosphaerae]